MSEVGMVDTRLEKNYYPATPMKKNSDNGIFIDSVVARGDSATSLALRRVRRPRGRLNVDTVTLTLTLTLKINPNGTLETLANKI